METRKIYVTGGSTFAINLPKQWVTDIGLKRGDLVTMTPQEGAIIIEPGMVDKGPSEIELKISEMPSRETLERLIISYYLVGYDTIRIRLDTEEHLEYKKGIRQVLELLIGVELVEDIGDMITLEVLLDHQRMSTSKVLKRMYLINMSMLSDLLTAMENRDTELPRDIMGREREVDRLYFLAVRQLKSAVRYQQVAEKLGIDMQRDALGFRIVVKSLERIGDHLYKLAEDSIKLMEGKGKADFAEFIDLANDLLDIFEDATISFFKKDIKRVDEVFEKVRLVEEKHDRISNKLFTEKKGVQESLLKKSVLDSIIRIGGYSSDIAEIAINMSVKVP